jgi:hypothetical protein
MSLPKIYSKTGRTPQTRFNFDSVNKLLDWTPEPNIIYHYQIYDLLNHKIKMRNCLESPHWDHFKSDPTTLFLYENSNETFDQEFCRDLAIQIQLRNLPQDRIIVVVCDQEHKDFLESYLDPLGIKINIGISWQSIFNTKIPEQTVDPMYKFSCLSRNYKPWRLRLFADLLLQGVLDEFVYTFHNIEPYGLVKVIPMEILKQDLSKMRYDVVNDPLSTWLENVPYSLDTLNDVSNKFHDSTFTAIQRADVNLAIETHFDFLDNKHTLPRFLTEKTFKSIACERPFILYGPPNCLKAVTDLGFKTFHPYIDESYDTILNSEQRHRAILNELERLTKLDRVEYAMTMAMCRAIAQYNKEHLKSLKEKIPTYHEQTLQLLQQSASQVQSQRV